MGELILEEHDVVTLVRDADTGLVMSKRGTVVAVCGSMLQVEFALNDGSSTVLRVAVDAVRLAWRDHGTFTTSLARDGYWQWCARNGSDSVFGGFESEAAAVIAAEQALGRANAN